MSDFIPGLELSRRFYVEAVAPILHRRFPGLRYSAGLVGYGSELLGFDDAESRDHNWGPRLVVFLSDPDYSRRRAISRALSKELPVRFLGYSTNFDPPDSTDGGTRILRRIETGPVDHAVEFQTTRRFLRQELNVGPSSRITKSQWLRFSQQSLLEITAGEVFHDAPGELARMRSRFAYYPRRVWLELMARKWDELGAEEAFVGRTGFRGDEIGSRLIAARQVRRLMELCFLIERRYAPYSKWFGTAFRSLNCSQRLVPVLDGVLAAQGWHDRQSLLSRAYEGVARMHNRLAITRALPARVSRFHDRPYLVISGNTFASAIRAVVRDSSRRGRRG